MPGRSPRAEMRHALARFRFGWLHEQPRAHVWITVLRLDHAPARFSDRALRECALRRHQRRAAAQKGCGKQHVQLSHEILP